MEPARVQEALEQVLTSATFARSPRMAKLLRFLVQRHLEGRDDELKESLIGIEVFGRKPDYDPKLDSTVRTEAVRLRARLGQYYSSEGLQDAVVIELPKGGYVPRCRLRLAPAAPKTWMNRRRLAAGLSVVLALGIAAAAYRQKEAPIRMVVFPLVNLSGSREDDSFVDGLTDEIVRQASGIAGVQVRSRTTSFALKGEPHTVGEAAAQLDVEYVVEGSVTRSGGQVQINTRLVRARDDVPVWSGTFQRHLWDALATQREISRGVVNALQLKLARGLRRYDTEAYDLYLRGSAATNVRFPGDDEIIGLFEQAIGMDGAMAPADAALAVAYAFRSFQSPVDPSRSDTLEKMRAAAERAIALDPSLPEAHAALGVAYANAAEWDNAERQFRHAIALDPALLSTRQLFARFVLWPLGRMNEAVKEAEMGAVNDPLSPRGGQELAEVLLSAGRYDEAAHYCEQLPLEVVASSECVGRARLAQGRAGEAVQILASSRTNNWGYLAYAYAKAGRPEKARALSAAATARYPHRGGPFQHALLFAGLGDRDKAIEQLERMAGVGCVRMGFTLMSPEFAFLNGDPRVKALRSQVGLPE